MAKQLIISIGAGWSILATIQSSANMDDLVKVIHKTKIPSLGNTKNFHCTHFIDPKDEIHLDQWKAVLHMYLESTNADRTMLQTWMKQTPQFLTDDQSIESETPFRRPSLEDEHSDIPY